MKTLPADMAVHLSTGATTLCWCWRLLRRDGIVLGFTDHDRDLKFDGTTHEAAAGLEASALKETVGLSVDNLDVHGAVTSQRLDERDLLAGFYDDARVEVFRVNWQDTSQRILMRAGSLGEVQRSDGAFVAEVRGLAHYLQQPKGRLYQFACDADLGDGRCRVNLSAPAYRGAASVVSVVNARRFNVTGLAAFSTGWFTRGVVRFDSGANGGSRHEVRHHEVSVDTVVVELWHKPARALAVGDGLTIMAGCDKALATCRDKFANVVNFRGFAQMPGTDFVTSYVQRR